MPHIDNSRAASYMPNTSALTARAVFNCPSYSPVSSQNPCPATLTTFVVSAWSDGRLYVHIPRIRNGRLPRRAKKRLSFQALWTYAEGCSLRPHTRAGTLKCATSHTQYADFYRLPSRGTLLECGQLHWHFIQFNPQSKLQPQMQILATYSHTRLLHAHAYYMQCLARSVVMQMNITPSPNFATGLRSSCAIPTIPGK